MKNHNIYNSEFVGTISSDDKQTSICDTEKGLVTSLDDVVNNIFWKFKDKSVVLKITIDIKEI